jgi:hypothetical protein
LLVAADGAAGRAAEVTFAVGVTTGVGVVRAACTTIDDSPCVVATPATPATTTASTAKPTALSIN